MHKDINEIREEMDYQDMAMKWYGWGSPIGLSIFFLTLAAIAAIIKYVFFA